MEDFTVLIQAPHIDPNHGVWIDKNLQHAGLTAGCFRYTLSFYCDINPVYLHVMHEKPTGLTKIVDLIRGRDLTELRPVSSCLDLFTNSIPDLRGRLLGICIFY